MNVFRYIYSIILICTAVELNGQHAVDKEFLSLAESLSLIVFTPVENGPKISGKGSNRIFTYDARIKDRSNKQETFIMLDVEDGVRDIVNTPHIEFTRMIANLGSNDDDATIWARILDDEEAASYGADWAAEARFNPKRAYTSLGKARLFCIYREGTGMASVLYCHDERIPYKRILEFMEANRSHSNAY